MEDGDRERFDVLQAHLLHELMQPSTRDRISELQAHSESCRHFQAAVCTEVLVPVFEQHGVDFGWYHAMTELFCPVDHTVAQQCHWITEQLAFGTIGPLELQRGDCVEVSGIDSTSRMHLDGQKGVVLDFVVHTGDYEVNCGPERAHLRPEQLRKLDDKERLVSLQLQLLSTLAVADGSGRYETLRAECAAPEQLDAIQGHAFERHGADREWLSCMVQALAGEDGEVAWRSRRFAELSLAEAQRRERGELQRLQYCLEAVARERWADEPDERGPRKADGTALGAKFRVPEVLSPPSAGGAAAARAGGSTSSSSKPTVLFVDSVNRGIKDMNRALHAYYRRCSKSNSPAAAAFDHVGASLDVIMACTNLLLRKRFRTSSKTARDTFEMLANLIAGPLGISACLQESLKKGARDVQISKEQLDTLIAEASKLLGRLLDRAVVRGDGDRADAENFREELARLGLGGGSCPGPSDQAWQAGRKAPVRRLLKTTPEAMTRLLWELRARFGEPAFQEEYHALRNRAKPGDAKHVEFARKVQMELLPKYGFEETVEGIMDFIDEAEVHKELGGDAVVGKLGVDVDRLLSFRAPLPLVAGVDAACGEAALRISQADVLLLCTGAGFSADSGLAVYDDVARVPAYANRKLEYKQICEPHWLRSEPELFWGFWGQCHNDYRCTAPHEGYEVISRWADARFRHSELARAMRWGLAKAEQAAPAPRPDAAQGLEPARAAPERLEPYQVLDHAGAFFAFTSNVDAHHYDWFRASEIRECHGSTELYQCAFGRGAGPCKAIWRAPLDFRFGVDAETMLAPKDVGAAAGPAAPDAVPAAGGDDAAGARIGRVRGGGRPLLLRHMPGDAPSAAEAGFLCNHPVCPCCGGPARPAILMFGDAWWQDLRPQAKRWLSWSTGIMDTAKWSASRGEPLRVVVLEIGAGERVTTVRSSAEGFLLGAREAGADVRLVRVNPRMPLAEKGPLAPDGSSANLVISILASGLDSIRKMDAAMPAPREAGGSRATADSVL